MPRPETPQDAVALVRQSGLVKESDLTRIVLATPSGEAAVGTFTRMLAEGLLTRYQAEELAAGRWQGFWLGPYKVLDRLGRGGMGHVYLGEHTVLGKRVAVKVLSAGMRADPSARRRFVREARAAATVDHPNVVHVFGVDMEHDPPYLVMEFVDGVSVQAAVARHGTFSGGEAAAIGVEVARGLSAAAAAGLVHRDVKPANLLIDRRGGVKILDLGIVRLHGDDTQPKADGADVILGTLDYLAPEQALDSAAVDGRADLYSLGATLYFALAGHPPFPGTDIRHKLAAKQYSDPPPVHRLRPDVDAELSHAIQKLLARGPDARFQSAADVVAALAPFANPAPDFPRRLFRSDQPSTLHDVPLATDGSPLPPTQRMLRPTPRQSPTDADPQGDAETPPEVPPAEGAPTDRHPKWPTDVSVPTLPPTEPPVVVLEDEPPEPRGRHLGWVLLALGGIVAAAALLSRL